MARYVHLGGAKCALDIGDGSERGEYVNQDYMLSVLGRPHRMVDIMYTYYPNDSQWPMRISKAMKDTKVSFQWDYPYDDYNTFILSKNAIQYEQMADIRRHGQDVMLTLTIDCGVDDKHLKKIAKSLRPYGRMCIRINHECNGNWFTHNKRYTFEEIAEFFERFTKIIKKEAPQVRTIFCAGLVPEYSSLSKEERGKKQKVDREAELRKGYEAADIWSADRYLSLHYGWPYDVAEAGGGAYYADSVDEVFSRYKDSYERLTKLYGDKPFIQAEFNSDGDVTGPLNQGEAVKRYYNKIKKSKKNFINGISMYQFRDRGRLGLEIEDPNNPSVGIKQPIMDTYKKVLFDPFFYPEIKTGDEAKFPAQMRWGDAEDADGISIELEFEKTPEFCEVKLEKELSLMMEFNGKWFYKAPGVEVIDLMPAFFEKKLGDAKILPINIFATPADGKNHNDGHKDYLSNYYITMKEAPEFRIRYDVPGVVG